MNTATIKLRALPAQRELISLAAAAQGVSRSAFIRQAACERAEEVLLERTSFVVSEAELQALNEMLDAPPVDNPGLEKLLAVVPPWPSRNS